MGETHQRLGSSPVSSTLWNIAPQEVLCWTTPATSELGPVSTSSAFVFLTSQSSPDHLSDPVHKALILWAPCIPGSLLLQTYYKPILIYCRPGFSAAFVIGQRSLLAFSAQVVMSLGKGESAEHVSRVALPIPPTVGGTRRRGRHLPTKLARRFSL